MTPATTPDITVVHIISVAYSGSTWLNLLLGSHPRAVSIGEMKRLLIDDRPTCTVHDAACPFWSGFDPRSGENPFLQIARLSGKDIIVINNSRKLVPQQEHPGIRVKWINLIRDGRAVAASYIRKNEGVGMWRAARWWSHDIRRNQRLMARQHPGDTTQVIYEDLLEDTERGLLDLSAFLRLDFDPSMLNFWDQDHHYLGGNRGTIYAMLRRKGEGVSTQQIVRSGKAAAYNWDFDHYKQTDPEKFRDERWRQELTPGQLRLFGLLAGRLNRSFGYR